MATGAWFNLPAVALIAIIATLLIVGVHLSANFNNLMVAVKLCIVVLVIAVGLPHVVPEGWSDEQALLMRELALVSRALKDETCCDKLNVAAIGNVVPQLHVHIVARRKDDAAWPKPVWGAVPRLAYAADAMERFIGAIRGRLVSSL